MDSLLQQANCNMAICLIKKNEWSKIDTYLRESAKGPNENIIKKALYWQAKKSIRNDEF